MAASSSGAGGFGFAASQPNYVAGTKSEVLADIFNKIAQFEGSKTDENYKHLLAASQQLDSQTARSYEEAATLEFDTLLAQLTSEPLEADGRHALFDTKFQAVEMLDNEFASRLPEFRGLSRNESALAAQKNSLLHAIEMYELQVKELQESCRTAQKKNKDALEEIEKVRQAGISRTFSLGQSCQSSIDDVLNSLQCEEDSIKKKIEENEDLNNKLTEFKAHLAAHSKQLNAQKRAVDLQNQLVAAKRAQVAHHQEQCRLLSASYSAQLAKQHESLRRLQEQVMLYKSKFFEFEASIEDTKKVFVHFEVKSKEATSRALSLEENTSKILKKAELKHKELDKLKQERAQYENEKSSIEEECGGYEKMCRELAAERISVLKQIKDVESDLDDDSEDEADDADGATFNLANPDLTVGGGALPDSERPLVSEETAAVAEDGSVSESAVALAPSSSSSSSSSSSHRRGIATPLSPGED